METKFNLSVDRLIASLLPLGLRSPSVQALLRAGFAVYRTTRSAGEIPERGTAPGAVRNAVPGAGGSVAGNPSKAGSAGSASVGAEAFGPAGGRGGDTIFGAVSGVSYPAVRIGSLSESDLATRFAEARAEDRFRLRHNGQVCYLRAALNARFRSRLGLYFRIEELWNGLSWLYAASEKTDANPSGEHIMARDQNRPSVLPPPEGGSAQDLHIYAPNETLLRPTNSFIIFVPSDIYHTRLDRVRQFVDEYRLVSRTAQYEPINS